MGPRDQQLFSSTREEINQMDKIRYIRRNKVLYP